MTSKLLGAIVVLLLLTCLTLLFWIASLQPAVLPIAWGLTFLMLAGAVTALVVRRMRARRAARGIEAGLKGQEQARERVVRPDLSPELAHIQDDFDRAIKALKSSRIGSAGRDALYYLPWYVMIGPSGVGKSTALRNSGLRFPNVMPGDDPRVKGIGGTRNCDFWLSNEAVLLDTAGRWSTDAEDKDEWLQFLRLLKKHRSRKPLNGVIAAISIADIASGQSDDVETIALRIRERIDELLTELRVALPVYLLFTKCDLIQGFVDMFGALRASEREQVWGFTLPLIDAEAPERKFEQEFQVLDHALHGAALGRMGVETQLAVRQQIFEFPQQFRALGGALSRFVAVLLHPSVYHEPARLRGVYFSSGTQEGRPFNLLQGPHFDAPTRIDQKSYFLRGLFMDVIFADNEIAAASPKELRRRQRVRFAATGALALVSVALLTVPSCAFFRESDRLAATSALARSWETRLLTLDEQSRRAEPHEFISVLDDLQGYDRDAPSWWRTLGMTEADRVVRPLRTHHHALLQRWLVRPVAMADVTSMTTFGAQYSAQLEALPSANEHQRFYELLKQHLLLSKRQLEEADAKWLSSYLADRLREHETRGTEIAKRVASAFVALIPYQRVPTVTVDSVIVQRVRAVLTRVSVAQRALDTLVLETEPLGYDLALAGILGRSSYIRGDKKVRGAFTRRGWEARVRARLPELAKTRVDELWVLGLTSDSSAAKQAIAGLQELEALYQERYIEEWSNFLYALHVLTPETVPDALALLAELTGGEPTPYKRLFVALDQNARLELKAREDDAPDRLQPIKDLFGSKKESTVSAASDIPLARTVRDALEPVIDFGVPPQTQGAGKPPPVPLDGYLEQVRNVREALQTQLGTPTDQREPDMRLQTARSRVRNLIETQDPKWRPVFEALLWPPLQAATSSWSDEEARRLGSRWCNEVAGPFDRALRGKYPFLRGAPDAALDDFDALYRPGDGGIWGFVNGPLGSLVTREGSSFRFKRRLGDEASAYTPALLSFLERSLRITSGFYPLGSKSPRVDFHVKIKPTPWIARTTLSIGGKAIQYGTGPEVWQDITWPGPEPMKGASFAISGANLLNNEIGNEGVWGFMRLLERAQRITRPDDQTWRVEWLIELHQGRYQIVMEFRASRVDSPILGPRTTEGGVLGLLRASAASAPHQLTLAGQPCNGS